MLIAQFRLGQDGVTVLSNYWPWYLEKLKHYHIYIWPGASRERCDLCHQRNCTYEISDLTNQSTLSSVTYNKDTLVYKLYGEDPLDSWEFTVVMPAIIVSSFVVGQLYLQSFFWNFIL